MALRVHNLADPFALGAIRLVIDPLAAFVFYHVTLIIELFLRHRVKQAAHAVRL